MRDCCLDTLKAAPSGQTGVGVSLLSGGQLSMVSFSLGRSGSHGHRIHAGFTIRAGSDSEPSNT